jgi:hypothetical protein
MMARVNVYETFSDGNERDDRTLAGWFETSAAQSWSDVDYNGNGSRGIGRGQAVWRTKGGRWVLQEWTNWEGEIEHNRFISPEQAREWLLANNADDAVEQHFGPVEDERGPGRPEVGKPVQIRFPDDMLAGIDAYASEQGVSRAEAVRQIVSEALAQKTAPAP